MPAAIFAGSAGIFDTMAVTQVPLVAMLKTRLHWYQTRQKLLAENVANADTPGFKPRELRPPSFGPTGAAAAAGIGSSAPVPVT